MCFHAAILDFNVVQESLFKPCKNKTVVLLTLKFILNKRKRFFLYISARHTWDHKTFMQIKVEVNDLCENLPLTVENVENFPQMQG